MYFDILKVDIDKSIIHF